MILEISISLAAFRTCFGVLLSLHIFHISSLAKNLFICADLVLPMFVFGIRSRNFPNTKTRFCWC